MSFGKARRPTKRRQALAVALGALFCAMLAGLASQGLTPGRAANTLWVRTDGSDVSCNGSANASAASAPNCAKQTIQAGIDAASAGDTINVGSGAYSETASGRTLTSIGGTYTFGLFFPDAKPGLTVQGVDGAGNAITSAASALATINTNATNNFGPSGVFVEGDNETVRGVIIGTNSAGQNKTIEVVGNAFTLDASQVNDPGGSVYINDFRFDTGTNTSHVQSYSITGDSFADGVSVDLASGAGFSGPVSGRQITGNTFAANTLGDWPMISFNGSGTAVPWFTDGIGGAVITGNTFGHSTKYIRARGDYDNSQFDWASYFNNNTYSSGAVVVGSAPPATLTEYSYPNAYGTFNHVRQIGGVLQTEVDHANPGDTVLATSGQWDENVSIATPLTLKGVNAGIPGTGLRGPESVVNGGGISAAIAVNADNVTIDGWTIEGGQNGLSAGVHLLGHQHVQVLDNVITDNQIGVAGYCGGDCLIQHNYFVANNRSGAAGGAGIYTDASNGLAIDGNFLEGQDTNNPIIFGATSASSNTNASVTENIFRANLCGCSAVYVVGLDGGTFARNDIQSPGATGIRFGGADGNITVTNNFLTNSDTGVRVVDDGYGLGNNHDITVHDNDLSQDTTSGLDVDGSYDGGSADLDGIHNWWGNQSGPSGAGPGSGTAVSANAGFSPWLCVGTDTSPAAGFQPLAAYTSTGSCDTNAPQVVITANVIPYINPYTAGTWTTYSVQVHFTCVDNESGMDTLAPNTVNKTLQYTTTGIYTASVTGQCQDKAGNVTSGTFSFGLVKIDKLKPTCTVQTSLSPSGPWATTTNIPNDGVMHPVYTQVSVSDAPFGPPFGADPAQPAITLTTVTGNDSAVAADYSGWTTGTPDFDGQVRGKKARSTRLYSIIYTVTDAAGLTGSCTGYVKVP